MDHADLRVKDALVFNSYFKRFHPADVYILDGRVLYVDAKRSAALPAQSTLDAAGRYMIPGLIDIHMHIESSMLTPGPFCHRLAACGVTTIVSEPHEIANVCGADGVRHMIRAGEDAPIDVYCGIPSSVPSTSEKLETTGASIGCAEMIALLDEKNVVCVGEIMNYRQIIRENDLPIGKFLTYLRAHRPYTIIEGHCPALTDLDLAKFLYLGINADHTEHSIEELRQRFENGMFVEIQEKMLKPAVLSLIEESNLHEHFCFVTDDCMADELWEKGHLDVIVRRAIALGMRPEDAIYAATFTSARRMNLTDRGAIAPGKLADFSLLDDLRKLRMTEVYKNGRRIWSEKASDPATKAAAPPYRFPAHYYESVRVRAFTPEDFTIHVPEDCARVKVNVMEVNDGSTKTTRKEVVMPVKEHHLQWEDSGCLLALVCERYGKNGNIGVGFVTGDCLKRGAVATTYFHDHHNLCVIGGDAASMRAAAERVVALRGGIVTAEDGAICKELPLPVGGILSDGSAQEVGLALKDVRAHLIALGYRHYNPIMSLCTLGLPVSPALKLTDCGLVDVKEGRIEKLYTVIN